MKTYIKSLALITAVGIFSASCGSAKKTRKKAPAKKTPKQEEMCLVDCPSGPDFGNTGNQIGTEGPGTWNPPTKSEPGKYEPGKYEPGKYEPGKYEPVYTPSEPAPTYPTKDSTPTKEPETVVVQNACAYNKTMNVNGYSFYMTRYTTTFYTTIGSTGVHGNYVTVLDGKAVSINNSFTHYVKDGVLRTSNGGTMANAEIVAEGTTVKFANIYEPGNEIFPIAGGEYDVQFDLAPKGACLARYSSSAGDYSGGYPVLVLP